MYDTMGRRDLTRAEQRREKGERTVLKLVLGRPGTGKTTALLEAIGARSGAAGKLHIVAEHQSHDAERRLCAIAGNRVSQ